MSDMWASWELHLETAERSALDRVVLEVVRPAAETVAAPWFFLRFWQGGPHVRLRVRGLDKDARDHLRARLKRDLPSAAAVRDAERRIDPELYREEASRQASGETGPDSQVSALLPAGVYDGDYAPEIERYGGPEVMADSEHLFWRSSQLCTALLPSLTDVARRRTAALLLAHGAAMAIGSDPVEIGVFAEIGRRSWLRWAQSYGFAAQAVERVLKASPVALPSTQPAWAGQWESAVADLVARVEVAGLAMPGAVVSSHVHMTHNRLGLGILDELLSYVLLSRAYPVDPVDVAQMLKGASA